MPAGVEAFGSQEPAVSLSQCPSLPCAGFAALLLPHLAGAVIEGASESAGRVVLLARPAPLDRVTGPSQTVFWYFPVALAHISWS